MCVLGIEHRAFQKSRSILHQNEHKISKYISDSGNGKLDDSDILANHLAKNSQKTWIKYKIKNFEGTEVLINELRINIHKNQFQMSYISKCEIKITKFS